MEAIWILAGICGGVAAFCTIGLCIMNMSSESIMWYREAERWRKYPR